MARAIIRYSINGEQSNETGNQARKLLEDGGFEKFGTASFDHEGPPTHDLVTTLRAVMQILEAAPGGGELDHLWIYVDRRGDD